MINASTGLQQTNSAYGLDNRNFQNRIDEKVTRISMLSDTPITMISIIKER